jgi:hypothetical protein
MRHILVDASVSVGCYERLEHLTCMLAYVVALVSEFEISSSLSVMTRE